jgi:hypothetical protein
MSTEDLTREGLDWLAARLEWEAIFRRLHRFHGGPDDGGPDLSEAALAA